MKKARIMLMSIAILAIVGGALAFKAQRGIGFCTDPVNTPAAVGSTESGSNCSQFILTTTVGTSNPKLKFVYKTNDTECADIATCTGANLVDE
jgi:hypothetical protein